MSYPLSSLADFLFNSYKESAFNNARAMFEKVYGDKWTMLLRKGVYPYEYMTSFDKFKETQLPPIEAFYSKLSDSGINGKEYEYAQKVWADMNIKDMGEYTDLYLLTDACLGRMYSRNFARCPKMITA